MKSNKLFRFYLLLNCHIFSLFLLFVVNQSMATNYCVTNESDLITALNEAKDNGVDDIIRIQQGIYYGNFFYVSTESFGVTIEGGYDVGCASKVVDPGNTVLDAQNNGAVLQLSAADVSADFVVDGITLQNGEGGGLKAATLGTVTLTNNTISNNEGINYKGGGVTIDNSGTVILTNNTISNNFVMIGYGGIRVKSSGTVTLAHNTINSNRCMHMGDGGVSVSSNTVILTNNTINDNSSGLYGTAGVILYISNSATLTSNTICNNSAPNGNNGAVYISNSSLNTITLTNNTICNNSVGSEPDGITLFLSRDSSIANIYNNIMWNNFDSSSNPMPGTDLRIYNDWDHNDIPSIVNLYNNNFDQSEIGTYIEIPFSIDPSNLNKVDPLFVDPLSADYHLMGSSSCIDTGSNGVPNEQVDSEGNPRFMDGDQNGSVVIDMGAYEYGNANQCTGHFDQDGDVDGRDLSLFTFELFEGECDTENQCEGDYNVDGIVDYSDLNVFRTYFGQSVCQSP